MNTKAATLLEAFEHLPAGAVVVEIGCVRAGHEIPSDGYSTVYLAQAAQERGWVLHSVDIDPAAVGHARALTDGLPNVVHEADGETWLRGFGTFIDGLYLDGSADPAQTLAQYKAAPLSPCPVVVVDDVQSFNGNARGKGDQLLDRLEQDGFAVTIRDTEPGYLMAVAAR